MAKVTNAELHKLITDFKADFTVKCDGISKANEESIKGLAEKIDGFVEKLENLDQRLDKIDEKLVVHAEKVDETERKIAEVDKKVDEGLNRLNHRIAELETHINHLENIEIPNQIRQLEQENLKLKEELESRTNRQLRRTLIFKNIPERKEDESYSEVKALLAETISMHTVITKEEALAAIERAHREAKRNGSS